MKPAVIIIDMLDDFVTGALANPRSERIIPNIAELAARARERGWPVVYANDAHLPGDFEERVLGPHALAGTAGARVIEALAPQPGDLELPKRVYSAFHETGLDLYLRQHGVDTVILTGQHTNICVRHGGRRAVPRLPDHRPARRRGGLHGGGPRLGPGVPRHGLQGRAHAGGPRPRRRAGLVDRVDGGGCAAW